MLKPRSWNKYPIQKKLTYAYLFVTIAIYAFAGAIFVAAEYIISRHFFASELSSITRVVNINSAASLTFFDSKVAKETLQSVFSVKNIEYAAIIDRDGHIFVEYKRKDEPLRAAVQAIPKDGHRFGVNTVDIYQKIHLENEVIGYIHVRSNLNPLYLRLAIFNGLLIIILALSLAGGYRVFSWIQKVVTKPIQSLVELMGGISRDNDYSRRAPVVAEDEIGLLSQGFNEMLQKVEQRDAELEATQKQLEKLIERRTAQLIESNQQLQHQLSERMKIEQALSESELRYRTIFETSGSANVIIEHDMTISMANSAFVTLAGFMKDEIERKKKTIDLFVGDDVARVREYHYLRRINPVAAPKNYEARFVTKGGDLRDVYVTVSMIPGTKQSVASLIDLTDYKRLESQLLHSQKMEAIGQLAGGVAHDFNNILTAIIGYASLMNMKIDSSNPLRTYADSILSSAHKAAHLTQGLLAFSRKQIIAPKSIDLNGAITKIKGLLERLMGEDVTIEMNLGEGPTVAMVDQGQFEQILINFATNARDAMPDGGIFRIETGIADIDAAFIERHGYGKLGTYSVVTVSDTGTGMAKAILDHIFEPFYTTKEVGKGTGLGLAIIYGIVKQHNGYINVSSEEGQGTVFHVYLPFGQPVVRESQKKEQSAHLLTGKETVLVAEDDENVRRLAKNILEEYGYTVLEAADGQEAVHIFRKQAEAIDIALFDVIMPKKNGKAAYEEIRAIRSGIKALFISGYSTDVISKKGALEEGIHFLSKPVAPHDLLVKIRSILDGKV